MARNLWPGNLGRGLRSISSTIIRSPNERLSIPDLKIHEYVWNKIDQWADKIAMEAVETGQKFTYAQVQKASSNFASLLRQLGFNDGSRRPIALFMPNCPEFPVASFGALEADLPVTCINPAYTAREVIHQLKNSQAGAVVCLPSSLSTVQKSIEQLPDNEQLPIFVANENLEIKPQKSKVKFLPSIENPELLDPNLALLLYSSGTSGPPKGVKLSHKNIVTNCVQISSDEIRFVYETTPNHQFIFPAVLPYFHCYGFVCVMTKMMNDGVHLVNFKTFDPKLFAQTLLRKNVETLYLVPPLILFLTNSPEITPNHLSNLKYVLSGAAPLGKEDADNLFKKGPHIKILQGYGMTEASPVTNWLAKKNYRKAASVGKPLFDTEIKFIDVEDKNKNLPPNEIGELLVKGPQIMLGYLGNPDATAEMIDSEGWLHTGDLGYYDTDGDIYIIDRLKELIKVKGLQVAPAELEELLRAHPQIIDAAVIGIKDARLGEAPKAYVVQKPGTPPIDVEEVKKYIADKVAKHKQLVGGVEFVESIPKNATGKILRKVLREKAQNQK